MRLPCPGAPLPALEPDALATIVSEPPKKGPSAWTRAGEEDEDEPCAEALKVKVVALLAAVPGVGGTELGRGGSEDVSIGAGGDVLRREANDFLRKRDVMPGGERRARGLLG